MLSACPRVSDRSRMQPACLRSVSETHTASLGACCKHGNECKRGNWGRFVFELWSILFGRETMEGKCRPSGGWIDDYSVTHYYFDSSELQNDQRVVLHSAPRMSSAMVARPGRLRRVRSKCWSTRLCAHRQTLFLPNGPCERPDRHISLLCARNMPPDPSYRYRQEAASSKHSDHDSRWSDFANISCNCNIQVNFHIKVFGSSVSTVTGIPVGRTGFDSRQGSCVHTGASGRPRHLSSGYRGLFPRE
jgi:hypothetical protein